MAATKKPAVPPRRRVRYIPRRQPWWEDRIEYLSEIGRLDSEELAAAIQAREKAQARERKNLLRRIV